MGTEKRARQKANRQARLEELEAETKAEVREQATRRWGLIALVAIGIIGLIVLLQVLGGGDDNADSSGNQLPTPTPLASDEDAAPAAPQLLDAVPADFAAFSGSGALAAVEPTARNGAYSDAPELTIDPAGTYAAVINTDAGRIRLELFAEEAPLTVNNFVSLARDGFYDGTTFHRVIEGFMAQAGDPAGTGTGGPGYSFADEFDSVRTFETRGILAMANTGAPNTNGSQFFITFEPTPNLDGRHTIFGQLANPDDPVLDDIVRGEPPTEPTIIESIQIIEG